MAASDSSANITQTGTTPIATTSRTTGAGAVEMQQTAIYKGQPNASGPIAQGGIAAGTTVQVPSPVPVTSGKTGSLQHAIFSSTQPTLWTVVTVNNSGALSSVVPFLTNANEAFDYKPGLEFEILTVASTGAAKFQVAAQNVSANNLATATVYAGFWWGEN